MVLKVFNQYNKKSKHAKRDTYGKNLYKMNGRGLKEIQIRTYKYNYEKHVSESTNQ